MDGALSTSLPDLSGSDPAGPNLEFDPEFIELDRLAQGKAEQQYGSTIVAAEEPDWKAVEAAAQSLMARTYDLRVVAHLAVARLHRSGMEGYTAAVGHIRDLLENRWASVHPQLDPEDDNDPTLRANALLALGEPGRVLRVLRTLPLARSARAGSVSWRDIGVANGSIEATSEATKLTDSVIAAAFRETDPVAFASLRAAVKTASAEITAIGEAFDSQAGYGTGPDFTDLSKLLREMGTIIANNAPSESSEAAPVSEPEEAAAGLEAVATAAPTRSSTPAFTIATMGPPTNRADALRLLDLVIEFYQKHEPSSPLPLLIARARRLADMSFMDILRDMAPDGVGQAERIAGSPPS